MIDPARSFDRAAEEYERFRLGYPPAILDLLPLHDNARVLDLGAGTGKLTRVLTARYDRVIAVEPLDGMRGILARVLPGIEAHAGSAESIPLEDASVDGVFAAAAFHWFANDAAVAEIGRVLRRGGVVCLISADEPDTSPFPAEYDAYLERYVSEAREPAEPWPELLRRGPFAEVHEEVVADEQTLSREHVLGATQTVSWVARRPDDERAQIARDLEELLGDGPFVLPLRFKVTWAVRA